MFYSPYYFATYPDIINSAMPSASTFQTDLNNEVNPLITQVFPIMITLFAVGILLRGLTR